MINSDDSTTCAKCGRKLDNVEVKAGTGTQTGSQDMDNYVLKPDTILEKRYRIERVIGEGGFGITYEAVNEKIDMTVAIKELYCREYIKRNVSESDNIQFTYIAAAETFAHAKRRFLQEAKILCGFSNETAIVKILDYFEANGTAYIVMNYLHGTSLDKYLKQNGPMSWETVLEKFKPLIATLERIHNRGVIHRDISTSNIMMLEDGSLCLLDFGSAKDSLKSESKPISVVYAKQGYTPIEQYAKTENIGSWSDVYALSAVCYECLTGECPPDSLQRATFDEYKTLKEQGKNVPAAVENLLKKGLAVQVEDRYANMKELLDALNQILSKKKLIKPKKRVLIIFLIIVLFGIGSVFLFQIYREEILFHFEDTETFYLVTDEEVSIDAFNKTLKTIEERIQILVGDEPYILEEKDGTIRGVLPLKCFGKEDPVDIVRSLISYPNKWTIMGCEIERKYIANINYKDNKKESLVINLVDETPKELQDALVSLCENGNADLVVDSEYKNCLLFEGKMQSSLTFTWNIQSQWKEANIKDLFLYNITHETLNARFNICPEIQAIWEEKDANTTFGKRQCNISELSENRVTLELVTSIGSSLTDGEVIDFIIALKENLDLLDIPYAIGRERNDKQRITLCINQKDYNQDMFFLMLQSYADLEIQDMWGRTIISGLSLENLVIEDDAPEKYTVSSNSDASIKEVEKNTGKMINKNITEYYLTVNNVRLLKGELTREDGKLAPIKDGVFHLHSIHTDGKISDEYTQIINLCNQILLKKQLNNGYHISISHYSNGKEPVSVKPEIKEEGFRFDTSKEDAIIEALTELSDEYEIKSYYNYDDGGEHLIIILPSDIYIEYFVNSDIVLGQIKGIMDACGIQNGTPWNTITIGVLSGGREKSYAGKIFFSHPNTDKSKYPYSICIVGFDKSETKWLKEIYNEMKSDKSFKDYQIEFEDYSEHYIY